MAQFFFPPSRDIQLPGFYNVDGVVGASPAANLHEDVLMVQFLFRCLRGSATREEGKAILNAITLDGIIGPNTIEAIKQFQNFLKPHYPGTIVDGRVSPAYGSVKYTIYRLNDAVHEDFYDVWPRLDRMPECPSGVRQMVIRTLAGRRP